MLFPSLLRQLGYLGLALLFAFTFAACDNDDDSGNNNNNNNNNNTPGFRVTVNGTLDNSPTYGAVVQSLGGAVTTTSVTASGGSYNYSFTFALSPGNTGTYALGGGAGVNGSVSVGTKSYTYTSGEVRVTTFTSTEISGTFSGTVKDNNSEETLTLTNGSFTRVPVRQ
jgi:hypothetical protein